MNCLFQASQITDSLIICDEEVLLATFVMHSYFQHGNFSIYAPKKYTNEFKEMKGLMRKTYPVGAPCVMLVCLSVARFGVRHSERTPSRTGQRNDAGMWTFFYSGTEKTREEKTMVSVMFPGRDHNQLFAFSLEILNSKEKR